MTPNPPEGGDRRLERELRAVAAERSRSLVGHPSPDELVDYHLGVLSAEEVERVQDHLTLCRECSQVVLDLAAFSRPLAEGPKPPVADLEREWERLEARLEREPGGAGGWQAAGRGLTWALAASVLAALGLLGWNLVLKKDLTEARRPRADIVLADLAPEGQGAARTAEAPTRVRVRPEQERVLLLLNLGDLRNFPDYRMELLDPEGGVVWAQARVPRGEDGIFLLEIPARMLQRTKPYRVRLFGERDGQRIALAGYSFEVVRGGPSVRKK
jgi:hypothetical protein